MSAVLLFAKYDCKITCGINTLHCFGSFDFFIEIAIQVLV